MHTSGGGDEMKIFRHLFGSKESKTKSPTQERQWIDEDSPEETVRILFQHLLLRTLTMTHADIETASRIRYGEEVRLHWGSRQEIEFRVLRHLRSLKDEYVDVWFRLEINSTYMGEEHVFVTVLPVTKSSFVLWRGENEFGLYI
jgi:hypothetical protein